jgi:ATP-binding cassette subfamily B protein
MPGGGEERPRRFGVPVSESTVTLDELLAIPPGTRSLRRLPEQLGRAVRLAWDAAPRQLILVAILELVVGLGTTAQVLVANRLLAVLLGEHGKLTFDAALPWIVLLGIVTVCVRLANMGAAEVSRMMSGLVERRTVCEVADSASGVELIDYERPAYHDLLQRAQLSATTRPVQMVNSLTTSLGAIAGIAGIGAALIALAPLLLALLAIGAIPVWLTSRAASRALRRFAIAQTERDRQRNYFFLLLTHREWAAEVRAFSLVKYLRGRLDQIYSARLRDLALLVRRRIVIGTIGGLLSALGTIGSMLLLVWLVIRGHLALSTAGAAAGAVVLLGERLHGLANGSGSLYENSLYMEDFTKFVERWPTRTQKETSEPALHTFSRLEAENVTFTYPSRSTPALDGVSVEIRGGEVVALVGENGSGKTTLAKVLAGLYAPDSGQVSWDDEDMTKLNPDRLHRSVAAIFQEYGKYFMTASENIAIGDVERGAERQEIEDAARQAGADGFIGELSKGYDNLLGSEYFGGANISLGQWQRIALARAYFRDAPFVILDEPTASLDPKAEFALFENVRTLYKGRSVLLISHRFGSARTADRIYVMDSGRVIETGSHEELMESGGRYAELFRLQASAYGLDVTSSPVPSDPSQVTPSPAS